MIRWPVVPTSETVIHAQGVRHNGADTSDR
jgi:hypothetical protein